MKSFLSYLSIGLFFWDKFSKGGKEKMETIEFLKELHGAKEVWFYWKNEEIKKKLEQDLEMDLSSFNKTLRFDETFSTWSEVSDKLISIYHQCGGESMFGGTIFVDYEKYLNNEPYIIR